MVLDFSLELKDVEGKCKDVENRFKEKQEGEARIIHNIKLVLQAYRCMWATYLELLCSACRCLRGMSGKE